MYINNKKMDIIDSVVVEGIVDTGNGLITIPNSYYLYMKETLNINYNIGILL